MVHWLALATLAHAAEIHLESGQDFCTAARTASAGDIISLGPGTYAGPCTLTNGGVPGDPITIRAADGPGTAAIVYTGSTSNVIDVAASDITLEGLAFGPTNPNIDAIKIQRGDDLLIDSCVFEQIGGISVSANTDDTHRLTIRNNTFRDLQATGIYVGCHDGRGHCAALDVLIEGNLIDGVDSSSIGYGLEVKLDSTAVIRDNVIWDTKGPGIEVYGSVTDDRTTLVERNLVGAARTTPSLEVGGGPATVRSNIVLGGAGAGLLIYDYGGRGLVRGIGATGNTVQGDTGPAIVTYDFVAGRDLELQNNAAFQIAGGSPLPPTVAGVPMEGNIDCTGRVDDCFADAEGWDFGAVAGGLLDGAGTQLADPGEAYCGESRPSPPTSGATVVGHTPVAIDFKDCAEVDDPQDTGVDPRDTGAGPPGARDTGGSPPPGGNPQDTGLGAVPSADSGTGGGCGCSQSRATLIGAWFLTLLAVLVRRPDAAR